MTKTSPLTALLAQIDELSPNTKVKGDYFELLTQWWLENDPYYKAKFVKVWPFKSWPGAWSNVDLGTDLIAEDDEGKFVAIQAKGYAWGHPILFEHMGTFLTDSNRPMISYRMLVTSTDGPDLHSNSAKMFALEPDKPVIVVDRSMLEKSRVNWPTSVSDLGTVIPQPEPLTALAYQEEAIADLLKGFAKFDRGQLIMPPGTGKTLTSVFFTEAFKAQNILVLVPSLALLGQSLIAWRRNLSTAFKALPVGSDETISDPINDGVALCTSELGFPVTTDIAKIADFLGQPGTKVLLSTYQSAPQVAAAQAMVDGHEFDLAIADEAHHTAGPMVALFATILHDEKIKATKRLFMTATQKGFGEAVLRAAEEADFEHASMDDEKIYGPVFHRLPFGRAIEEGLITDYRIVIPTVTDDRYLEMATNAEFIRINGVDVVDARKVASHIALLRVMREYDRHRVIAFLNTNKKAGEFAKALYDTWAWMPAKLRPSGELWSEQISGEMTARKRNTLLGHLREPNDGSRKVLSNVRVLSEGVDVPALDAVIFAEPKRSPIEIIQAIGRVVRLDRSLPDPAAQVGYVIVPAFVPAHASIDPDTVLADSAFRQIARTFKVLALQDERLAERVNRIRRGLGPLSKGPKLDDDSGTPLDDQLCTDMAAVAGEDFARAFLLMLVKSASASFEEFFGHMERYIAERGDALVPVAHVTDDGYPLGVRVNTMRTDFAHKPSLVSAERIARLNDIGFVWSALDAFFEDGVRHSQAFHDEHGRLATAPKLTYDGFSLRRWEGAQREAKAKGDDKLTPERIARLDAIGFVWDPDEARWMANFEQTRKLVLQKGSVSTIKDADVIDNFKPYRWIIAQRQMEGKEKFADRIALLKTLPGWVWNTHDAAFEAGLAVLKEYRAEKGHANPGSGEMFGDFAIYGWVNKRRTEKAKNDPKLTSARIAALDALDFVWSADEARWMKNYTATKTWMAQNGNVTPKTDDDFDGCNIGTWGASQRVLKRRGKLLDERINLLENLPGWEWEPRSGKASLHWKKP